MEWITILISAISLIFAIISWQKTHQTNEKLLEIEKEREKIENADDFVFSTDKSQYKSIQKGNTISRTSEKWILPLRRFY